MQDRIGQRFGNYQLIRLIGEGGYAEVYLAEHVHLKNRQYAIKVLTGTNLEDYQREEFLEEARTVADLGRLSSHIVQIFDFGIQIDVNSPSSGGIPYLVMEYAAGGTLRKLYPHGTKVPLDQIKLYVNQISEALQCAHDHNPAVVHRDVKPENMLLRDLDYVLLSDFGIALTGQTGLLLKPAKIFGTATYIAPERLKGVTRRASDQYSLGVIVYEWLCGHPPFDGNNQEICYKHMTISPEALYPTYPYVTPEIDAIVRRALEKVPEDRYPTVREFAQVLEQAIQNAPQQQAQVWQPIAAVDPGSSATIAQMGQLPVPLPQQRMRLLPPQQPQPQAGQLSGQTFQTPADQLSVQPPQQQAAPSQLSSVQPIAPLFQLQPGQQPPDRFEIAQMFAPLSAQPSLPPAQFMVKPPKPAHLVKSPGNLTRNVFEFSSQFAIDSRNRVFRNGGIALNIFSSLLMFLLLENVYIAFIGLLFSSVMFALCIRAVDERLAIFFGVMVALYWGAVGWVIDSSIVSWLNLNGFLSPILVGVLFFGGSLGLHIWYVSRKI